MAASSSVRFVKNSVAIGHLNLSKELTYDLSPSKSKHSAGQKQKTNIRKCLQKRGVGGFDTENPGVIGVGGGVFFLFGFQDC